MVINSEIPKLQKNLESIAKRLKGLKRKKGKLTREWVEGPKNILMGVAYLFGEDSVRDLGKPNCDFLEPYRHYYFKDIRCRSKLRKIRDKISDLEIKYRLTLLGLRNYLHAEVKH